MADFLPAIAFFATAIICICYIIILLGGAGFWLIPLSAGILILLAAFIAMGAS